MLTDVSLFQCLLRLASGLAVVAAMGACGGSGERNESFVEIRSVQVSPSPIPAPSATQSSGFSVKWTAVSSSPGCLNSNLAITQAASGPGVARVSVQACGSSEFLAQCTVVLDGAVDGGRIVSCVPGTPELGLRARPGLVEVGVESFYTETEYPYSVVRADMAVSVAIE